MISEGVLVFNKYLEKELIKNPRLYNYFKIMMSDEKIKDLPQNFTALFDIIYSCNIYLSYKLEMFCYIINRYINYCYNQINDDKLLTAIDYIKIIIAEDNSIKELKYFDDKIEFAFALLGINKRYSLKIIDSALRNYEYEIIYDLKKTNF